MAQGGTLLLFSLLSDILEASAPAETAPVEVGNGGVFIIIQTQVSYLTIVDFFNFFGEKIFTDLSNRTAAT